MSNKVWMNSDPCRFRKISKLKPRPKKNLARGGSIRPWCTYCNAWKRSSHSHLTLGKDRHIHIRIYACATLRWRLKRLLWRDGEGWQERERVLQNISGWLREKAFAAACTDEYIRGHLQTKDFTLNVIVTLPPPPPSLTSNYI